MSKKIEISPLRKVIYPASPPNGTPGSTLVNIVSDLPPGLRMPKDADFVQTYDYVSSNLSDEMLFLDRLRAVAALKDDIESVLNVCTKRTTVLGMIFKFTESKFDFLIRNKLKNRSFDVVSHVVNYIFGEIRSIAREFGNNDYFIYFCKALDERMPQIEEMISNQINDGLDKDEE